MRTTIMMSVKPIILGRSAKAVCVATYIFLRYSLFSAIFAKKIPLTYRMIPFARLIALPRSANDRFIIMSLEHFAREQGDSTYLLIPCTEGYRGFVERHRDTLESKFIIRHPDDVLKTGSIFPIAAKGKDL